MKLGWWRDATSSGREEGVIERLQRVLWRVWSAYRRQRVEYRTQRQGWAEERAALLQRVTQAEEQAMELRAAVGQHVRARFGRRTEQKEKAGEDTGKGHARGQQRGAKGHGRQRNRYESLPIVDVIHDVPEQGKWCEKCGAPRIEVAEDVSDELDVELVIRCRRHHRKCYVATCGGGGRSAVVRGEAATKLVPRCSLSYGTISFCVTARYLLGLPLHRITTMIGYCGAQVPDGTLVGVFHAVQPLLQPLYDAICERNRQSECLHADETTWRQLWVSKGKRGYIWCFAGPDTTVYIFEEGRDHSVVLRYLGLEGREWAGHVVDIMCDFLQSYDKAAKIANASERRLELSRCWTHYRRLFLDIPARHPGDKRVAAEVSQWLGMIADLFRLHHERDMAEEGSQEQEEAQVAFRGCLQEMEEVRARQLRRRKLAPELRHVLDFGAQHWEQLIRCAADPHHPIDNNFDERQIRLPVIIRKNAYGSGARWAVDEACQVWTIGKSALQNGRNPWALIAKYFEACAQAGGKVPSDWERFLPWLWSEEPSAAPADPGTPPAAAAPTETAPEARPDQADPSATEPLAAPSDDRGDALHGPFISVEEKPGHPSRTPPGSMAASSRSVNESATPAPTGPRAAGTRAAHPDDAPRRSHRRTALLPP